jgi:hypothetical protein
MRPALFKLLGKLCFKITMLFLAIFRALRSGKNMLHSSNNIFDTAPYLAPWYFTNNNPKLIKNKEKLQWKSIDNVNGEYIGVTRLQDRFENPLGFIKMYTYIHPSTDATKFFIWNRALAKDVGKPFLTIEMFDVSKLEHLDKTDQTVLDFNKSKQTFRFGIQPTASMKYFIEPFTKEDSFSFPKEFKIFNPFLVITDYDELYKDARGYGSTLVLEFDPMADKIRYYPQDWFNKSDADFGYQWITRAVRDNNGSINVQGIRISDFILDKTGTQLLNNSVQMPDQSR